MLERASNTGPDERARLGWLRPHVWTVAPRLRHMLRPEPAPSAEPWQTVLEDPAIGAVRLTGRLRREAAGVAAAGDELLVLVHGLGGTIGSHYMLRGARAAAAAGVSCLRLNLRGADCSGDDFYHAGMTADVHAALASPDLRTFRRIFLLGYSLGGHLVLRWSTEEGDPRVRAAAAVCSPLDLGRAEKAIDSPEGWLYRRYLMSNLTRVYAAVAARRPMPLPVSAVAKLRKIRDFDEHVVAPRHGFSGAEDYYERASVAPLLGELRLPSLLVNAACDPLVQASAVLPALERPAPRLEVRWVAAGGHVGFPTGVDLALESGEPALGPAAAPMGATRPGGPSGVDEQVIAWLRRH
jgi:predicted alpha/beta-fold hydrolase